MLMAGTTIAIAARAGGKTTTENPRISPWPSLGKELGFKKLRRSSCARGNGLPRAPMGVGSLFCSSGHGVARPDSVCVWRATGGPRSGSSPVACPNSFHFVFFLI